MVRFMSRRQMFCATIGGALSASALMLMGCGLSAPVVTPPQPVPPAPPLPIPPIELPGWAKDIILVAGRLEQFGPLVIPFFGADLGPKVAQWIAALAMLAHDATFLTSGSPVYATQAVELINNILHAFTSAQVPSWAAPVLDAVAALVPVILAATGVRTMTAARHSRMTPAQARHVLSTPVQPR